MSSHEYPSRLAFRRGAGRCAVLVCGLGLGLTARAYDAGITSEYTANQVINSAKYYDRSWQVAKGSNGVTIGRDFTMRAPGGRTVPTRMTTSGLTGRAAAGAAARVLSRAVLPIAIGVTIWDLYNQIHVRPDGNGGLVADPMQGQEEVQGFKCYSSWNGKTGEGDSAKRACGASFNAANVVVMSAPYSVTTTYAVSSCTVQTNGTTQCLGIATSIWQHTGIPSDRTTRTTNYTLQPVAQKVKRCPAYTSSDGVAHPPGEPPLSDGTCPTGQWFTIEDGKAADRLWAQQFYSAGNVDMEAIWNDILMRAPEGVEIPADAVLDVATPASIAGPETTTINSDGTTTTEAVGWSFSKISDSLGKGKDFKVVETKKTTVKDANGNTISETTTGKTTTGETAGDKVSDQCKADPGSLGCIGLGEPPTVDTPKVSKSLVWESTVLGLPVGCPGAQLVPGVGLVSYQQTCETAQRMRPFIVAGAAFASLMIVLAVMRS